MCMQVQLSICFVERRIKDKLTAFSRNESTGCVSALKEYCLLMNIFESKDIQFRVNSFSQWFGWIYCEDFVETEQQTRSNK